LQTDDEIQKHQPATILLICSYLRKDTSKYINKRYYSFCASIVTLKCITIFHHILICTSGSNFSSNSTGRGGSEYNQGLLFWTYLAKYVNDYKMKPISNSKNPPYCLLCTRDICDET